MDHTYVLKMKKERGKDFVVDPDTYPSKLFKEIQRLEDWAGMKLQVEVLDPETHDVLGICDVPQPHRDERRHKPVCEVPAFMPSTTTAGHDRMEVTIMRPSQLPTNIYLASEVDKPAVMTRFMFKIGGYVMKSGVLDLRTKPTSVTDGVTKLGFETVERWTAEMETAEAGLRKIAPPKSANEKRQEREAEKKRKAEAEPTTTTTTTTKNKKKNNNKNKKKTATTAKKKPNKRVRTTEPIVEPLQPSLPPWLAPLEPWTLAYHSSTDSPRAPRCNSLSTVSTGTWSESASTSSLPSPTASTVTLPDTDIALCPVDSEILSQLSDLLHTSDDDMFPFEYPVTTTTTTTSLRI